MSGRIPKTFIDELLLRADIVEVIDARVPLKKAGKDYKACCPFHDEKTASFTVSAAKQFFHCFGCGAHGTVIGFLMDYEHMDFVEAIEDLAGHAGLEVPREGGVTPEKVPASAGLVDVLQEAARFYRQQLREHPQAHRVVDYLKGRGITGEIAQAFSLGYAPEGWDNLVRVLGKDVASREQLVVAGLAAKKDGGGYYDRFRNRVIFPIQDYRGRIVGFGGRVMENDEPKYLNSPETPLFHKGRELYGLYRAREAIKRENRVLVVEGYMDVVALAQFGIDNVAATLGTAATREHLERLFRFAPDVVFCFDGDRAGRDAAWRALDIVLPLLHEGRQAAFLFLPDAEDPDSLVRTEGRDAFLERVKKAILVPEFMYKGLSDRADSSRSDYLIRLAELAKPYLSKVPDGILHRVMLERLKLNPPAHEMLSKTASREERLGIGRRLSRWTAPKEPPSAVRLAVAMLIQHPELAAATPEPEVFTRLNQPGRSLLVSLLRFLQSRPGLNTAAIIEHFRDTSDGAHLAKLAVWDHPALQHDVEAEFTGVIEQLRRAAVKAAADQLLQKQRIEGLTIPEKAELTRLLTQREALPKPPVAH